VIIALLADIHSNLEALNACLNDATKRGAERFAFLGDLVGYGADPAAVVDTIARYAEGGAIVVKGNHDESVYQTPQRLNDAAKEAVAWTRKALSADQRSFLASLSLIVRDGRMCFVHGSAVAPQSWEYIETATAARLSIAAAGTTYTFSGHVHDQVLYFMTQAGKIAPFRPISGSAVPLPSHRRWLAIVGSVGQPRDGNPAAAYALFDSAKEEITFFRVPYDHLAAARKIRDAGLPAVLAERIERGI
jgi:diadenosine tetraphosphatase ApaH/serine/threonine PP2A family protein phosphatase